MIIIDMVDCMVDSWTDDIKRITGLGMIEATQLASDRPEWRALVKATAAPSGAI